MLFSVSLCLSCFRLVLSFLHLQPKTYIKPKHKNFKKHRPYFVKNISQPELDIFIRGRVEGWISCICVLVVLSVFRCLNASLRFLFSLSLFKLLHLQSKNTYDNIQTQTLEEQQNNINTKNITKQKVPAGTWEIFIRGRVEGWISCIVCFCLNVVLAYENTCNTLT